MEIVILVGIPGSGKTTLALNSFPNHKRINLDTLQTRKKEDAEIANSLSNGQNLIIDNTNATEKSRSKYIQLGKQFGVPVKAVYIKTPVELALKRNASREGKARVPDSAVRFYFKILQPPSIEEGLDRVDIIEMK